jgi:hypothetical protein
MATEKQLAAKRRNALLTAGPRSVEGKAAASGSALKTGLYWNGIIVGKEDPGKLAALEAAFTAEYAPATPTAFPRRQESWTGNAFMDQPAISRIHRLRNSTQRMFHETLAQRRALQAERQTIEDTNPDPEIGFVPSNAEEPANTDPRRREATPRPPAPSPQSPAPLLESYEP